VFFRKKLVFFIVIFCLSFPSFSDEPRWFEGFFIEGSLHQYSAPDILSELVNINPGFRAAFGYDFRHFRFAVESGFTDIQGDNPLVLDITIIPLALKFGYELPVYFGFGIQADLHGGYFFSRTNHYVTALDMIAENLQEDNERNLFAGGRLYLTWTTKRNFLKVYAGGGTDVVFETDGPIHMPLAEAGISIKPFTLIQSSKIKIFNPVYFEVNSAVMLEEYKKILDEAGRHLQEKSSLRLTMRTYTPPSGNIEWQVRRKDGTPALSAARAAFCTEYLQKNYGVSPSRIKIEYKDIRKINDETQSRAFRCVDLVIK
jgi:outer membrane protein OmpA-like peptidoglycan-associated protein